MWNPTDTIRSFGCRFGLYIVMMLMLLYASHLQIESRSLIFTGTNEVTQALRFSAIMIMEQNEYQADQSEEQREEQVAARYHHAAHTYTAQAKQEEKEALRSRTRSESYDRLSKADAKYANVAYHQMLSDDHARLELLQNIAQEVDQIDALRQEEVKLEDSPCLSWNIFENFCTIVHVVPDRHLIVSQTEQEVQTLVQERAQLSEIEQDEYIDGIVTAILQGYATKYNHTAQELLQQSMEWDMKMRHDLQEAREERDMAHEYDIIVNGEEEHLRQESMWLESNRLKSNTLFRNATYHLQLGRTWMRYSTMIGFGVLVYFVSQCVQRVLWMTSIFVVAQQQHQQQQHRNTVDLWTILWSVSYMIQHTFIFLVSCGWTIDVVTVGSQNPQTVFTMAFSAAMIQAMVLHTLPYIIYGVLVPQQEEDRPIHSAVFRSIGIQFVFRTLLYTISFALEFCIAWTVAQTWICSKENLELYRSGVFLFIFIIALTLHIVLEQRRWNSSDIYQLDEQATFLLSVGSDEDDCSNDDISDIENISRATSIDMGRMKTTTASHATSSNPTERMPFLVLRGFAQTNTYQALSISSSSIFVNSSVTLQTHREFIKLLLLLDTLMVILSYMMLLHGGNTTATTIMVVATLASIWVAVAKYLHASSKSDCIFHDGTQHDQALGDGMDIYEEKRLSFSKSFQTYNSVDV